MTFEVSTKRAIENWDLNLEEESGVVSAAERERERERSGGSFGPEEKVLPNAKSYYIYQFCFWDKDKQNGVFLWD